jgi:hypothetical protein
MELYPVGHFEQFALPESCANLPASQSKHLVMFSDASAVVVTLVLFFLESQLLRPGMHRRQLAFPLDGW